MNEFLKRIYEQKYKTLLLFPLLLIVLALLQIGVQTAATGDFVNKGITLKGGSTITLTSSSTFSMGTVEIEALENILRETFSQAEIDVRTLSSLGEVTAIIVDSDYQQREEIDPLVSALLKELPVGEENTSVEIIGSALGESFFRETVYALLAAFILMGIVVFISFRTLIPSATVIAAVLSDIIVTLAVFNLTGIKLSTAGIAAFLMLIGYSADTDILLNTRVLKRKDGPVMERVYGAIRTGMTMTLTTLAALTVALFFVQSDVIKQIMIILLIGLIVDIIMTWIQNVGLLRLYLERKEKKKGVVHGQI
ncbi:hypothetical protein J4210_01140 [Candidatus Woesearchaeota archaeon]|nr:hypothetical protein [Candidatus Woesearchaeota archaeon]